MGAAAAAARPSSSYLAAVLANADGTASLFGDGAGGGGPGHGSARGLGSSSRHAAGHAGFSGNAPGHARGRTTTLTNTLDRCQRPLTSECVHAMHRSFLA